MVPARTGARARPQLGPRRRSRRFNAEKKVLTEPAACLQPWVSLNYAQSALFEGTLTSAQWAHLAVTATMWLVLPAMVGLRLVLRSDVK